MCKSITQRFKESREIKQKEYESKEKDSLGNLRGGHSGIMSEAGEIVGTCPRVAHLRSLGIQKYEHDFSTQIMFDRGYNNEDMIAEDLERTLAPGEKLLREEEIPISWTTKNGTLVTGRPDIVIAAPANGKLNASVGLEIKSLAAFWSAKTILFKQEPNLKHAIQAAHYMWKMNIPWKIIYRQYAKLIIPDWSWLLKELPGSEKDPGAEFLKFNKKSKPQELLPFEVVFDLRFNEDGFLEYSVEDSGEWHDSIVSSAGIERYYEHLSQIADKKDPGPRALTLDIHGNKLSYDSCNYCPPEFLCKEAEKLGYDEWLRRVKENLGIGGQV